MKQILIFSILLLSFSSLSAQTKKANSTKVDPRFVGSWSGSEKGSQVDSLSKYWIQTRNADGTFVILFTMIDKDGEAESSAEKGKWWVEKGIFYESHPGTGKKDTYTFEFLDKDNIKFKLKTTDSKFATEEYTFIDTRVEEQ